MPPVPVFILCARGLESLAADELAAVPGVTLDEMGYRQVRAAVSADLGALLALRIADDAYLWLADWLSVGHTRAMLPEFRARAALLDLPQALEALRSIRQVPPAPAFSLTASFVGRRNYTADEIKAAVSAGVIARTGWPYAQDDRAAHLNLRIFVEHDRALVGLRLDQRPLHERGYKQVERPGSLKPTVAAALCQISGVQPGQRVIDPCCGAGTILIEAARLGAEILGGDLAPDALKAARANAQAAAVDAALQRWDARRLPLESGCARHLITNLPWGRQIAVDDALSSFYQGVSAEAARVLVRGGHFVVLTSHPELIPSSGAFQLGRQLVISLFGQQPTILSFTRA